MQLSDLIKYYRHQLGLSFEAIGDYVGVSKSTIKRWEDGESKNVPDSKLDKLSELFGIHVPAYIHGNVKPVLGYVKAGYDLFANEHILGYEEVSSKEASQGDYYLKVQGDSMIGSRIYDGDLIYVKSCHDVNSGEIAVILLDQMEVTIKKVIKKDDAILLMATNPIYEPKLFTKQDINEQRLKIIGKVVHVKLYF